MELERYVYPLLDETLNYIDNGVTGKIKNVVRHKNNKFVFHLSLDKCEKINDDNFHLAVLNEDIIPLSNVKSGSLLACLHPQNKKWTRCYIISICNNQAYVAICNTGEISLINKFKCIPQMYKNIPIITFEAELKFMYPHGKLKHLMEHFDDYMVSFDQFKKSGYLTHKKMKLIHNNGSLEFIISKWNPQDYINMDVNYLITNGSAVVIAKAENYDSRHIFVRSIDQYVNVCKKLQIYCENASNIDRTLNVGDVIAVKCLDTFYRGKIIDILDETKFSLFLIDSGYVISISIDCILDLSITLQKIPPTVCLVGLKDIIMKPWNQEAYVYITTLFENSTTMILEYTDYDFLGLDSVTLTVINNNEDVNAHLKELLKYAEVSENNVYASNPVEDLNSILQLQFNRIIPVKVKISDSQIMSEHIKSPVLPGSLVSMTSFVDLNEIYIRKYEDNDILNNLLDKFNTFCLSAIPVNKPLVIDEIVGVYSKSANHFFRGKVVKQINRVIYQIKYIDFGNVVEVLIFHLFKIPHDFMIPSNIICVGLKGLESRVMNLNASKYLNNILSSGRPMIIDFSPSEYFKNVNLTKVDDNENINERLLEIFNNSSTLILDVVNQPTTDNISKKEVHSDNNSSKLLKGDLVYITTFIDVHHIFVRKVDDEYDDFFNFIEKVNLYCSAETPIGKLPKLNDLIGAKSVTDGIFYRANVVKKINDVSYNVQFIDYGIEENIHLSDIVSLSTELKEIPTKVSLVKLKDVPFCKLNEYAREYVNLISEYETLIIDNIDEDTNDVILKTSKNQNINSHLTMLISGSNEKINAISTNKSEDNSVDIDCHVQFLPECNKISLQSGTVVYMTAFIDFNEIYIRKIEDHNKEYNNFLEKVNQFCSTAVPINRPLVIDEIVGALSILDGKFYRAKILKQNEDNTYSISFIDFGDKYNVPISNIFKMPKEFMIPSTIIRVALEGIKSSVLSIEVSNYITNLLSTYELMTVDFDVNLPLEDVTLTIINNNENLTNVLNKLLKVTDNNGAYNNDVKDKFVTEEVTQNITKCTMLSDETDTLKNGDIVYITACINLYNIFVRKVNFDHEFKKFSEEVNTYCSSSGNVLESKLYELNQVVGAKRSTNGYFYRGRIIGITDKTNYNVDFIDFGFEESVNIIDIIPLPIKLQQVKSSVSLVGLKGLKFETLNADGQTYIDNLILYNEIMKIEFEDLSAVTLTVISQAQNVVDYLNELCGDNTIINNPVQKKSPNCMKYISPDINIPQIPILTNNSIVTIYAFVSLKDISISVNYDKLEINNFLNDFSAFCMTSQSITRNPIVGEVFGILSSVNSLFNRGEIIEILNENQFKVLLFDLCIEEIVSANSIVEISEQLKLVPKVIYRIGLKDVNFNSFNAPAMSYVNMLCENLPLIIEFDEKNPNGLNSVTLITAKTQQNVNKHLVTLLAEKEERDSPETVHMLSKGDIVYISSFVDIHSIYVRRINNGTDRFKSFLEKFSSCCALENPIENDPIVGEIVAAKIENENKFYRAEIISRVDNEHYNICLVDFGTRTTVHCSNIVQPVEKQLQICPLFLIDLDGLDSDPKQITLMKYIEEISQTDTFIIDSITKDNKVTLISVKTKYNINKELEKLISTNNIISTIQDTTYASNGDNKDSNTEDFVIKYYKPPLEVPTQIWIAEKISASKYLAHTYNSRAEYMRLEKQLFNDSGNFESVKFIETNMTCITYLCPNWYRGEILEVVKNTMAHVRLIDIGNIVIRNIKEIFSLPSKYKGKSLLLNIELQPEPQEKLPITTFKIVPKKYLDIITIGEIVASSIADQIYSDLENVGLPSFSSTPISYDSDTFKFNDHSNMSIEIKQNPEIIAPYKSNKLTIKDIQYAKWSEGSLKLLTFVIVYKDCLILRDHMIEDSLMDLETKIQNVCKTVSEPYYPIENELCLSKYSDGLWYRAICIKTGDSLHQNLFTVYYLDWGIEYSVSIQDICEMSKELVYLPATAHKCYIPGVIPSKWSASTKEVISQYVLTQVDCKIIQKLSNDSYTISCDIIKNLIDANL